MQKQVLSIKQMQKLTELGIDTSKASMCWIKDISGERFLTVHGEHCYDMSYMSPVPTFTLQDILEILPVSITWKSNDEFFCGTTDQYHLIFHKGEECWVFGYDCYGHEGVEERLPYKNKEEEPFSYHFGGIMNENILQAAFDMLVWVAENGYLNKGK